LRRAQKKDANPLTKNQLLGLLFDPELEKFKNGIYVRRMDEVRAAKSKG